jgi:PAS domain S-box-containing protein
MGVQGAGDAASREFALASRLASIVESSDDAIIGKTLDGTITSWNAGAADMYGYAAAEMVGRNVAALLPPDRAGELAPILDRLARGERVEHFEAKRRRKDGSIIDVSVSISPIRDGSGAVVGGSTVARDMTERNRAEAERQTITQERQQSERREFELASRLAAIVESASVAIIGAALDHMVTSWNHAAERMLGYPPGEMIGRDVSVIVPPDQAAGIALNYERLRRGEQIDPFETQLRRKDGSIIDVSVTVSPIWDAGGTVIGVSSLARDVTERNRAEAQSAAVAQERQQSERRESELASQLAAIVESASVAIIGAALDHMVTSWNSAAERMLGYAPGEMIGRDVSVIVPPDQASELAPILDQLGRGERVEHFETQLRRKDGRIIDVSVFVSPVWDAGGALVGISSMARDVTERNRAEADRHALEQRLHQSERLESLGQLAGGIAHDFNNLLAVIMNYAGFVVEETADRPAVLADAEEIKAAAQRAARLTRQLLIFSRRETVQTEPLDLNAIVADVHNLLSRSIGAHVELQLEPAVNLPTIEADRGQIEQVLLNLAINARDAMPEGGTLTIGTSLAELGESYVRLHPGVSPGRYAELAVSDTGTGMSAAVAARIFEPFFTTKPHDQGTGLGLATVYGIVTQAGGSMSVESEEGTGTTFRLYFPAASVAAAATPAAALLDVRGHGETILVVDDDPPVLEVTSRILRKNGYVTLDAGTYEEALSLVASHDFQLLLTDSVMPRMSGAALAERITGLRPGLAVLYMSGYSEGAPGPQCAAGREAARIQKPFDGQTLLEAVHAVLSTAPAAEPG